MKQSWSRSFTKESLLHTLQTILERINAQHNRNWFQRKASTWKTITKISCLQGWISDYFKYVEHHNEFLRRSTWDYYLAMSHFSSSNLKFREIIFQILNATLYDKHHVVSPLIVCRLSLKTTKWIAALLDPKEDFIHPQTGRRGCPVNREIQSTFLSTGTRITMIPRKGAEEEVVDVVGSSRITGDSVAEIIPSHRVIKDHSFINNGRTTG